MTVKFVPFPFNRAHTACLTLLLVIFCTPSLAQNRFKVVLDQVIQQYPAVASAKSQINAAGAEVDAAKWGFYPTPSIGYERADKKTTGVLNKDTQSFRLQQPLWTAGRLTAQHTKSRAQLELAQHALVEQKQAAAFRWLLLWAEYESANLKVQAYLESEKKHLEYVRQIERRAQEGYSAFSDVQLSLSRLSAVGSELRQFQSARIQAANRLEQMLRQSLAAEKGLADDADWPSSQQAIGHWTYAFDRGQIDQMVSAHPAMLKAQSLILVAESDVALAKSRNLPEVYIRGEIRKGDASGTEQAFFVGLSSSFGAGLSSFAAVASAQARVDAAQNDKQGRFIEVFDTIQSDIQSFNLQFDRVGQIEKTFEANRNFLQSSERQHLAGRRSWQEILNIAREEAQILAQLADAKAQVWLMHQRLQIFSTGLEQYLSTNLKKQRQALN